MSAVGTDDGTERLRLHLAAGTLPDRVDGLTPRCRRALAVARAVGAPLLDAVDGAAAAEDDEARARRAVQVAAAQTRAVAIGLVAAPVLLVPALGRLVGADLRGFYTSPVGRLVLVVGLALLALGAAVIVVLVRRVGRAPAAPERRTSRIAGLGGVCVALVAWRVIGPVAVPIAGLVGAHLVGRVVERSSVGAGPGPTTPAVGVDEAADLVATALAGGVSAPEALRLAAAELPACAGALQRLAFSLELGLPAEVAGRQGRHPMARLRSVVLTATDLGAPLAPSLRRLARDLRADDLTRVLAAAERLPAHLTFPTALCLLPATVLLVGAPVVHAGLAAAGT